MRREGARAAARVGAEDSSEQDALMCDPCLWGYLLSTSYEPGTRTIR